nr:ABC transporter ATP-binding protein [Actinomycetota bacterium]NIS35392.1 ABC transporter ATP-binding protein [Actinomycetota bacterium]NIT98109.1 ABC transporter ATP-binding protein [Actinomycetota bacterium]NIU70084.1 ABC transporter ATP-binding protein [Actinomycetota bacterium]NIW31962.1 ABC transporter ATP-binding protein [Actinomycetota bacterium]
GVPVERVSDLVAVETGDPTRTLHALTDWALRSGIELAGLEVARPTLEDVYLSLVGERR